MSFAKFMVSASFTSALIALSLQPTGVALATSPHIFLVADPSSNSQSEQRDPRNEKMRASDAESSGKMQSTDPRASGRPTDPNSKVDRGTMGQQPDGISQSSGRQDSKISRGSGTSSGSSTMSGGAGSR
ncbi:MAG: hypothetical protein ACREJN_15555 [Nitrospiraceae bacterium]